VSKTERRFRRFLSKARLSPRDPGLGFSVLAKPLSYLRVEQADKNVLAQLSVDVAQDIEQVLLQYNAVALGQAWRGLVRVAVRTSSGGCPMGLLRGAYCQSNMRRLRDIFGKDVSTVHWKELPRLAKNMLRGIPILLASVSLLCALQNSWHS